MAALQGCLACYADPDDGGCWAVSPGGIDGICIDSIGFQCAGSVDMAYITNCTDWAAGLEADLLAEAACTARNACGSCIGVGGCYWLVREGVCTFAVDFNRPSFDYVHGSGTCAPTSPPTTPTPTPTLGPTATPVAAVRFPPPWLDSLEDVGMVSSATFIGEGYCRRGHSWEPTTTFQRICDSLLPFSDTTIINVARSCAETCFQHQWCFGIWLAFFDVDVDTDERRILTPICALVVDVTAFYAAGNVFSNTSWGGDQVIDGTTWRTHCSNATGGTCHEAPLAPGEHRIASDVELIQGTLCFGVSRDTAAPSPTGPPTTPAPTRPPSAISAPHIGPPVAMRATVGPTVSPAIAASTSGPPVTSQPSTLVLQPTSPLPTRTPTIAVDSALISTAAPGGTADPGASSSSSNGSKDAAFTATAIVSAVLAIATVVCVIHRRRAAHHRFNDDGASTMAPNNTFKVVAPVYDSVDYTQLGRSGQPGPSMAADYAVAQEKDLDSCYAVPPGATARSKEYEVPHRFNPDYQPSEVARGEPPAVAGEYDSVTYFDVAAAAGRGTDTSTYAVPDQSAAAYASTSSLGRDGVQDKAHSEA